MKAFNLSNPRLGQGGGFSAIFPLTPPTVTDESHILIFASFYKLCSYFRPLSKHFFKKMRVPPVKKKNRVPPQSCLKNTFKGSCRLFLFNIGALDKD